MIEMTDMIFSTDGEEKFRIPSPFSHNYYVVTKCPTHKLEIKERKMNKCKYFDCGWCYAPDDVKTNNSQGGCIHPECCPYLKSQNQMTNETDISKVLIEGDTATINGVKYKRVEEPKPKTLRKVIYEWKYDTYDPTCDDLVNMIEQWLPDEFDPNGSVYEYEIGWNEAIQSIKDKLK
jgi:hypothetical protein